MDRDLCYLSKGERALILRALKVFNAHQQRMISDACLLYKKKRPEVFADHKQHHEAAINSADDLIDRIRSGSIKQSI